MGAGDQQARQWAGGRLTLVGHDGQEVTHTFGPGEVSLVQERGIREVDPSPDGVRRYEADGTRSLTLRASWRDG
jgi:hypothetical protein